MPKEWLTPKREDVLKHKRNFPNHGIRRIGREEGVPWQTVVRILKSDSARRTRRNSSKLGRNKAILEAEVNEVVNTLDDNSFDYSSKSLVEIIQRYNLKCCPDTLRKELAEQGIKNHVAAQTFYIRLNNYKKRED